MHALKLKIPPFAVAVLVAALMWLVTWAVAACRIAIPARKLLAAGFAVAGVVMIALGVASLRRAETTVNPMKPDTASSLVLSGVYRVTRNPMYLGFLLLLAGWASFLSNALAFLLLPTFVFYMNYFQIEPEERALASRFGQPFVDYKSRVRRWL